MKLVVGLGNPGREYELTRHNVGFMVINKYLGNVIYKTKDEAEYYVDTNNKVIYLKPLSYMNESGRVVKRFVDYYKISTDDILIIYDDMDFEVGNFKIKSSGSCGGHNGIKSIIKALNTENIKRIRVGISRPKYDKVDYVLGNFSKDEQIIIDKTIAKISDVLNDYLVYDFEKLMNIHN